MKKLLILIYIIVGIEFVSALPENMLIQANDELKLVIKSELSFDLKKARIKTNTADSWIDLGIIHNGENKFVIPEKLNFNLGLLQIQEPNGQWMNGIFFKKISDKVISINISSSNDRDILLRMMKVQGALKGTVAMKIINETYFRSEKFFFSPVAESERQYSYPANCKVISSGIGVIECFIVGGQPIIKIYGPLLGTIVVGVYYGTFISMKKKEKLLQLQKQEIAYEFAPFYLGFNLTNFGIRSIRFDGGGASSWGFGEGIGEVRFSQ